MRSTYQFKSNVSPFGRSVSNSAYGKMQAILNGNAPHYAFLHYSTADWQVKGLFLVPGHFFTPALIQKRSPLTAKAERAGWVGSNILLAPCPTMRGSRWWIQASSVTPTMSEAIGRAFNSCRMTRVLAAAGALRCSPASAKRCGKRGQEFTLQDFYARHVSSLSAQFPDNHNVEAKVRQQLQVLRDGGVLSFLEPGRYQVTP